MSSTTPIAYTYDADTHCPRCARARFGVCEDGFIACLEHGGEDSEGNPVGAIFGWDDWCEPEEPGMQYLTCGTCSETIATCEHEPADLAYEDDADIECMCESCVCTTCMRDAHEGPCEPDPAILAERDLAGYDYAANGGD